MEDGVGAEHRDTRRSGEHPHGGGNSVGSRGEGGGVLGDAGKVQAALCVCGDSLLLEMSLELSFLWDWTSKRLSRE